MKDSLNSTFWSLPNFILFSHIMNDIFLSAQISHLPCWKHRHITKQKVHGPLTAEVCFLNMFVQLSSKTKCDQTHSHHCYNFCNTSFQYRVLTGAGFEP